VKKTAILKALLIVFPVLAVGLATTVDSVTVLNTVTGEIQYYSYFDLLPVGNLQLITPITALLSALSGVLAAVYMVKKRKALLKSVGYTALASATLAAIPVILREEIMVIPNVALPIFMILEFCVTYLLGRETPERMEKSKGQRLSRR